MTVKVYKQNQGSDEPETKMTKQGGGSTRAWFAGVTAAVLLACVLAGTESAALIPVLVGVSPLFAPTAIYYFLVKDPKAVLWCGIVLAGLTIPTALTLLAASEPPYALVGLTFFLTLSSSIAGALLPRQPS